MVNVYCSNCGGLLDEDSKFCSHCGMAAKNDKISKKMISKEFSVTNADQNYSSYRGNIQIIAILEIAFGLLVLFISAILGFILLNIPKFANVVDIHDPTFWDIWPFASKFLWLMFIIVIVYGILNVLVGVSLYRFNTFGRIGTMINGALSIFNVPFGTLFGIASIYLLTRPEADVVFNS